jgi:glycosyltransferase involved in cell wall biosynthesis
MPRSASLDILYIGTLPPHPGGTATVGAQLLPGLARLGHRLQALAPMSIGALGEGDFFAAEHPEIGVMRYPVPYFDVKPSYDLPPESYRRSEGAQVRERFQILISQNRPDVVLGGGPSFAWLVRDLTKTHGFPIVVLMQAAMLRRPMEELNGLDLIVLVARHVAEYVRGLGFRNFRVIPNGVDLRRFSPGPKEASLLRQLDIRAGQVVVAHVSNLQDLKRPLDIICAAKRVLRQNPDIVYVIVGDGEYRGVMEDSCSREGIHENFRFVGWVEHERMPEYLNLADIVVMPSEVEALALVYLEAQACGRVLLASDIPGAREIIRDGETGLLFRKGDVEDFAAKTLLAAGDADLRASIGRRARESVKTHDLKRTVASYNDVLQEIASRPHVSPAALLELEPADLDQRSLGRGTGSRATRP